MRLEFSVLLICLNLCCFCLDLKMNYSSQDQNSHRWMIYFDYHCFSLHSSPLNLFLWKNLLGNDKAWLEARHFVIYSKLLKESKILEN